MPKIAKSMELELFVTSLSSCERAGITNLTEIERAQHLLGSIKLTIIQQDRTVSVCGLIKDEIAEKRLGSAAVTRDFIFERYQQYYETGAHQAASFQPPAGIPVGGDTNRNSMMVSGDRSIKCVDCQGEFVFALGEQEFYKSKNLQSDPRRCPGCNMKYKAGLSAQVCVQFQQGACKYGNACRMKHGGAPTGGADPIGFKHGLVVIVCKICNKKFEEDTAKWLNKGLHVPKTCRDCLIERRKAMAAQADVVCVMEEEFEQQAEPQTFGSGSDEEYEFCI